MNATIINLSKLPCLDDVSLKFYPEGYPFEITDYKFALDLGNRLFQSLKDQPYGKITMYISLNAYHFGIALMLQRLLNTKINLLVLSGNVFIDMQDFQKEGGNENEIEEIPLFPIRWIYGK